MISRPYRLPNLVNRFISYLNTDETHNFYRREYGLGFAQDTLFIPHLYLKTETIKFVTYFLKFKTEMVKESKINVIECHMLYIYKYYKNKLNLLYILKWY